MSDFSLGDEFPRPTHDDWLGLVEKTLKGAGFDDTLISHTYDGLPIEPLYYRQQDTQELGEAPYRRGARDNSIHLCQSYSNPDIAQTNKEILDDLASGVSAIRLKIDDGVSGGLIIKGLSDLEQVLDGVFMEMVPVEIDAGARANEFAALLTIFWQKQQIMEKVQGAFLIDPIGYFAANSEFSDGVESALKHAALNAKDTSMLTPRVSALCADMRKYNLNGASEVQEIAISIATGVAYLRAMEQQDLALDIAVRQISFLFNVDADVFLNIAKLRAFRELWAQITVASGIKPQLANIKLETARRMMAARDPWVNMLRVTSACFAANVAGASSVTIAPYTEAVGLPDGFGRRIARNTHIVLQEEAHLAQVHDPAGGSWFIENLTDQMIEKAWSLFQEIEAEGGIFAALKSNMVQTKIAEVETKRRENIETGKEVLVGVNRFENTDEQPVPVLKSGGDNE